MNYIYYLLAIIGVVALIELVTWIVYGGYISKECEDVFMSLDQTHLRLNTYDPSILSTKPFISTTPLQVFCKYYIDGIGTVPRWSKLHKRIKEYYSIAIKNAQRQ